VGDCNVLHHERLCQTDSISDRVSPPTHKAGSVFQRQSENQWENSNTVCKRGAHV
jgi:hypothetical protein